MPSVQQTYTIYPDIGFPGAIARPTEPHATESGLIYIPTGGKDPSPGDMIFYNTTENALQAVSSAAQQILACGILGYRADTVAQPDSTVKFKDGDEIQYFTMGTVWVVAKAATEYGQLVQMELATPYQWEVYSRVTAIADIKQSPMACASRSPVSAGANHASPAWLRPGDLT